MLSLYIIEFLIFSFIGWIIDSSYRSIHYKTWINAGYFKGPFCPIFGVGGLFLVFTFKAFSFLLLFWQLLIASFILIAIEYVGGIFCYRILNLRLWDYSGSCINIKGHIDLHHSIYWVILTLFFYFSIFPILLILENFIVVPDYINVPFLVILICWLIYIVKKYEK